MHLIGSCLVDPAQFQTSSFAFDVRRWVGILPRLWAYSTRKVFPQVPPQHSQLSVLYRSIFDSPVFVFCRSIFSLKFVIIALLPRKTFTGKHTANHIHPASRGVAAHTAG